MSTSDEVLRFVTFAWVSFLTSVITPWHLFLHWHGYFVKPGMLIFCLGNMVSWMRAILTSLSVSILASSVALGCKPQTLTCKMLKSSVQGVGVCLGVGAGVGIGACEGVCVDDNPVANFSKGTARVSTAQRGLVTKSTPTSDCIRLFCTGI